MQRVKRQHRIIQLSAETLPIPAARTAQRPGIFAAQPCASAHPLQQPAVFTELTSLVPVFSGNWRLKLAAFSPSRMFPSSTTTTALVAENSRNFRQKLALLNPFLRILFIN
jgi:hypothetical protein